MFMLNEFLNEGITQILDTAGRFYLGSRRGQAFILKMIAALKKSTGIRKQQEEGGLHIPPFLIASITQQCNLHCTGCYARANGACVDHLADTQPEGTALTPACWDRIFTEASALGISFILLAGGEPLLRRDVIEAATAHSDIIFPVFTNGTMLGDDYLSLFDVHRNLIPVLSIEGSIAETDRRRGDGISKKLLQAMGALHAQNILYGASITVTTENMEEVTDDAFITALRDKGCGVIFFVEYVPAASGTDHLVLQGEALATLQTRAAHLRSTRACKGLILLSFPGDEDAMGGCLAAGRGFFHINAHGGAEPCPFSPYSALTLRDHSIADALRSPFFAQVRSIGAAGALTHAGGCTLFGQKEQVETLLTP